MTLLAHALDAARRGYHVFPVEPFGKTPGRMYPNRPREDAPWTIRWSEVATTDVPTIVNWWNQQPWFNVGIACKPSGLLVVDCDVKVSDGFVEWQEICGRYARDDAWELWDTYTVNTGSGGGHFYYTWPLGVQASQSGISTSVDIRSNGGEKGGYVLGAGSITDKGPYVVDSDPHLTRVAPPWLVELCREKPRPQPVRDVRGSYEAASPISFAGLVQRVSMAPEGDRNGCLLWAARSMCSDGATESLALDLLVAAAVDNGLHEREASDTIKSAYRLQRQKDGR